MAAPWFTLALLAGLILLNALLAGTEVALVSLREGQLRQLERRDGARERTLVRLARDPNRFLATIQVGITLSGFLASAAAAVSLAEPLIPALGFLGGAAEPVAIALITLALTFVTLVLGELAPKRLAMQFAQRWALLAARPLHVLSVLTRPAVWLLGRTTDLVVRAAGGDPHAAGEQLSAEELRHLVAASGALTPEQRAMIGGALDIRRRRLRAVLVPRGEVVTLSAGLPLGEARAVLAACGHSRAPVVSDHDLDDAIGVVTLRDLVVADGGTAGEVARPVTVLPGSLLVSEALLRFQAAREKFALVGDERGGIAGIITVEDLLEEIVGEIYDEADRDIAQVRRQADGSWLLRGTFPVHDLPDLGVELPEGDYTTIAGLVLATLGRIPTAPGDRVHCAGWTLEVAGVERHAITAVRLRPELHPEVRRVPDTPTVQ